jgi:hypothetical protein
MTNELPAPYVAASDTSRARAVREDLAGTTTKRRQEITELVRGRYLHGMTWTEISSVTGLHHGQVSGALSKLHEMGRLFQIREVRNGCHPYAHVEFRDQFEDHEVNDEPVKTRANAIREQYEALEKAAYDLCYGQSLGAAQKWDTLRDVLKTLKEMKADD